MLKKWDHKEPTRKVEQDQAQSVTRHKGKHELRLLSQKKFQRRTFKMNLKDKQYEKENHKLKAQEEIRK